MAIDFSSLSLEELEQAIEDAQSTLERKRREMKADIMLQMRKMASSIGVSIEISTEKGRSKGKLPPKYKNPTDASQTWTGRGPKPKWFKQAVASGKNAKSLLV